MKVIFPMTGPNQFADEQYLYPKPLLDVMGKTMFENALSQLEDLPDVEVIAAIAERDAKAYRLDQVIKRATEHVKSTVRVLKGDTAGALCTTLLMSDLLDNDEIIISNYDHHINFNVAQALRHFKEKSADFGVISFHSVHPKWSYIRMDEYGEVLEAAEKDPISTNALAGLYYFKSANIFLDAAKDAILSAGSDKERFYTSDVINRLVLLGYKGVCHEIRKDSYFNFFDSSELKEFNHRRDSSYGDKVLYDSTRLVLRMFGSGDLHGAAVYLAAGCVLKTSEGDKVSGKQEVLDILEIMLVRDSKKIFFSDILVGLNSSATKINLDDGEKRNEMLTVLTWSSGEIVDLAFYAEEA